MARTESGKTQAEIAVILALARAGVKSRHLPRPYRLPNGDPAPDGVYNRRKYAGSGGSTRVYLYFRWYEPDGMKTANLGRLN